MPLPRLRAVGTTERQGTPRRSVLQGGLFPGHRLSPDAPGPELGHASASRGPLSRGGGYGTASPGSPMPLLQPRSSANSINIDRSSDAPEYIAFTIRSIVSLQDLSSRLDPSSRNEVQSSLTARKSRKTV